MNKHLLCICLLIIMVLSSAIGQNPHGVLHNLNESISGITPYAYQPFSDQVSNINNRPELLQEVSDGIVFHLNEAIVSDLLTNKPNVVELLLPISVDRYTTVQLYKSNVLSDDFLARTSDGDILTADDIKVVTYRGIVKGNDQSIVAITISEDEIRGFVGTNSGDIVYGRLRNSTSNEHIAYIDDNLLLERTEGCNSADLPINNVHYDGDIPPSPSRNAADCVRMYLEIEYQVVNDKGGVGPATTYIVGLMNEVFTLYDNENITMIIQDMFLWSTDDPYSGSSSSKLNQFRTELQNNGYDGDLAHLIGYSGGGLAALDQLCNSLAHNRSAYSGISTTYQGVPTYSWSVEVVTHEIGHNLGSPHTHACAWNGNGTAIDGCGPAAGYSEGCDADLPDAGTIMSYCHLVGGVGIDFNLGFGTQPGNLIRSEVAAASCLGTCFCADLVVEDLLSMTADDNAGTLTMEALIGNIGDTATESGTIEVDFFLADDIDGNGQVYIGTKTVSASIPAMGTLVVTETFSLPASAYTKYYVVITVDESNYEIECKEDNNLSVFPNFLLPYGCTDPNAHNYDPNAVVDDGSCETCYDGVLNGDEVDIDCGGSNCPPCDCQLAEWGVGSTGYPQCLYPTFESADVNADNMDWGFGAGLWIFGGNGNPGNSLGLSNVNSGSLTSNDYFQFGMSPLGGGRLDLFNVNFDLYRESDGPTNWELRSSLDGYTSTVGSGTFNTSWKNEIVDLSSFAILTGSIDFRLYFWGAPNSSGRGFLDNTAICAEYVTCSDGEQNGDEDGIDCGGAWCDVCFTCADFIITDIDPTIMDDADSIHIEIEIQNVGMNDFTGAFFVDFFGSTNNTYQPSDTYLGSAWVNPGTLVVGEKIRVTDVIIDNTNNAFLLAVADAINESVPECSEDNNTEVVNLTTCSTLVTNSKSGAPGSFRWAVECSQPGDIILFSPNVQNDTIYIRDIDPIDFLNNLSVQGDLDANIFLAPHPDNTGGLECFEFGGNVNFEGLYFIPNENGVILKGRSIGGSVDFYDVEIQKIEIEKEN